MNVIGWYVVKTCESICQNHPTSKLTTARMSTVCDRFYEAMSDPVLKFRDPFPICNRIYSSDYSLWSRCSSTDDGCTTHLLPWLSKCCIPITNYTYTYACRIITTTQWRRATQFFRKIYLSLYLKGSKGLLKVLLWEGWVELQHIDPHSYGHNNVSFPFSCAAQPGAWGPSLSGTCSTFQHLLFNCNCSIGGLRVPSVGCWFSLQHLYSNCLTSCLHPGYIIVRHPPSSCGRHKSHSFNPSTVKVISWYPSIGCTCYLHMCISYFDSLAGVNMLQKDNHDSIRNMSKKFC